jgi:hypothetical protein
MKISLFLYFKKMEFFEMLDKSPETSETKKPSEVSFLSSKNSGCSHEVFIMENNLRICESCGSEIEHNINHDKDWKYMGVSDTRNISDPNRCYARRSDIKTILKDVENLGISERVINTADKIYTQVTKNKIYRGKSRRAIIFACVFHAYKLDNNPQTCDSLIQLFGITRKFGLKGLKAVNLNMDKEFNQNVNYVTPEDIISEIMSQFDANQLQTKEVIEMYKKVKNRSSLINRSRPKSIASGLVRYYILKNDKKISIDDFKSKVHLSELTINRIVKEIGSILDKNVDKEDKNVDKEDKKGKKNK